jgi:hypothetical protein
MLTNYVDYVNDLILLSETYTFVKLINNLTNTVLYLKVGPSLS